MTEVPPPAVRVAVIGNPESGRRSGAVMQAAAVARLRELGIDPQVRTGTSAAQLRQDAADAIAVGIDVLVVIGGDGTFSAVVDAIAGSQVPLVLVPAGTGNDLARALGLPFGSEEAASEAAALAVRGAPRLLDLAEAVCPDGARRFLTVAAMGFDARVADRTDRLRHPRGPLRYWLALVIELLRLRPMRFSIRVDGVAASIGAGTLVAVANTRNYGGGMPIAPHADPCDGMLEVVHAAPLSRTGLLRVLPRLLRGTHLDLPVVTALRGRTVEVSAPDLVVYADGERVGTGRVRIRVLPAAVTVMLPPSEPPPAR